MYIIEWIKRVESFYGNVGITIGNFEGFHKGHQRILQVLKEYCNKNKLKPAVLTFKTHPIKIIKGFEPEKLWSQNDKIKNFIHEGIEFLICINFTKAFANIPAENFIRELVDKINPAVICLGEEFRFGKDNLGSVDMIADYSSLYDYKFIKVHDEMYDGEPISSTRIRQAIKSGNIDKASNMLGRYYSFYFKLFLDSGRFEPFIRNQALPSRGEFKGTLKSLVGDFVFDAKLFFPDRRIEILSKTSDLCLNSYIKNPEEELLKFEFRD